MRIAHSSPSICGPPVARWCWCRQRGGGAASSPLVEEIPATLEGRIRVNIANALATLREGLRTFATSYEQNPGRFHLLKVDGRQVMIDYCHNMHGQLAVIDVVRRLHPAHRRRHRRHRRPQRCSPDHLRHPGCPELRCADDLRTQPHLPAGSQAVEIAAFLQSAILAAGFPADKLTTAASLREAIDVAIEMSDDESFVLLGEAQATCQEVAHARVDQAIA